MPRSLGMRLLASAVLVGALLAPPLASAAGSGAFTPTGSMGTPRSGAVAARLPDGRVLVAGGNDGSSEPSTSVLSSAEAFDPGTGSFSSAGIGSMVKRRERAAAAPLPDGRVLVAGGENIEGNAVRELQSAETFDPATGKFTLVETPGIVPIGFMTTPRAEPFAAPLPDGRVLVAGGAGPIPNSEEYAALKSAELFNPSTETFSAAGLGSMTTPRRGAAAAPLPDGRVLVVGGFDSSFAALSSAEIFDPATGSFSSAGLGSMGTARADPVAAPLSDGRVLIAGGWTLSGNPPPIFPSAEVFDPATNTFSSAGIGSMGTTRAFAAAATLADGRVLVAGGGAQGGATLSSAEIYGATSLFSAKLKGLKLLVKVSAFGQVKVGDAVRSKAASISKRKRRRRLLLRPSGASGGPGTIVVRLRLTRFAQRILKKKHKLSVRAQITFTPQGGLVNTRVQRLKIKTKSRRRHHMVGRQSARHFVRVTPRSVHAGETVRVHGSVDGGCPKGASVTLYSWAFRGATHAEFAGVPAVFARVRKNHSFSRRVELSRRLKPRRYRVGGRCGGGNFGSTRLRVTGAHGS